MTNKDNVILLFLFAFLIILNGCSEKPIREKNEDVNVESFLKWNDFKPYIQNFNKNDEELYVQYFSNIQAEEFLKENIPYFECPNKELEETYYFRWWTFRKHIKNTPNGFVITEFLPDVPWSGKYNTISCPASHHFYEGRWLHNQIYLENYANFWFKNGASPRSYSFWAANSILSFANVHKNKSLVKDLLPYLVENYNEWGKSNLCNDGLFWQADNRDGMEVSIGGSGKRATINSYMYGDAIAIADIAKLAGNVALADEFSQKALTLKALILDNLWDAESGFFKTLPLSTEELEVQNDKRYIQTFLDKDDNFIKLVNVRELHGFTPWYFNIPEDKHSNAWKFILSAEGFKAPYGPTTAEQIHPDFKVLYEGHECQWNGPSWPFATSITLKAMANLLRNYNQTIISKNHFLDLLLTYSNSHRRINESGKKICWIDENLNPFTGDWISRTMLKSRNQNPVERGKDYNHSAFCDFIISDLVGVRPSMGNSLTIKPLISEDSWDWFCLDRIKYHDKFVTVIWDKDGAKYQKDKGFSVYVDGELKHNSSQLKNVLIKI